MGLFDNRLWNELVLFDGVFLLNEGLRLEFFIIW
jgi:hypothetical protein